MALPKLTARLTASFSLQFKTRLPSCPRQSRPFRVDSGFFVIQASSAFLQFPDAVLYKWEVCGLQHRASLPHHFSKSTSSLRLCVCILAVPIVFGALSLRFHGVTVISALGLTFFLVSFCFVSLWPYCVDMWDLSSRPRLEAGFSTALGAWSLTTDHQGCPVISDL